MMSKMTISFLCLIPAFIFLIPEITLSQKAEPTLLDFKVQALYRAAKLTWKVKEGFKSGMSVQILRADTFEDGPYKEVEVVNLSPGKNVYEYVDKSMGAEAKYYYKLVIKETEETFGPISTRPYFSPPATYYQPPILRQRADSLLSRLSLPSRSREA